MIINSEQKENLKGNNYEKLYAKKGNCRSHLVRD